MFALASPSPIEQIQALEGLGFVNSQSTTGDYLKHVISSVLRQIRLTEPRDRVKITFTLAPPPLKDQMDPILTDLKHILVLDFFAAFDAEGLALHCSPMITMRGVLSPFYIPFGRYFSTSPNSWELICERFSSFVPAAKKPVLLADTMKELKKAIADGQDLPADDDLDVADAEADKDREKEEEKKEQVGSEAVISGDLKVTFAQTLVGLFPRMFVLLVADTNKSGTEKLLAIADLYRRV
jgi:hypothetical protein